MGYVLNCRLEIGDYVFKSCTSVNIESSRTKLGDTCVIELPTRGVVKDNQRSPIQLDKYFKEGMPVLVMLGYNGQLNKRFEGYIKSVSSNTTIKLSCEDEIYTLKRADTIHGTYFNTTLKALLKVFKPDIVLSNSIPDMKIEEFPIDNATPAECLQQIKDTYRLDIYFRNKKLFAGIPYTEVVPGVVKYLLRSDPQTGQLANIQTDNLEYMTQDNKRIRVKVVSLLSDNTKVVVDDIGDKDGELRTEYYYNEPDKDVLRTFGLAQYSHYKVAGYTGSFTTWGIPLIVHSQTAELRDPRYVERKGLYIADTVRDRFDANGWLITVDPGQKVSS